jgi:arylformamidase
LVTFVYRDYDQQALDLQYNNQAQVADPKRYLNWYVTESEKARARVKHRRDVAYGALPDEKLDIFMPDDASASDRRPVVVFSRMPAAGSLDEMVAQVRTAIAWLYERIGEHGGDRERLHLIGHSSGAHLVATALGAEWPRLYGFPEQIVRSAVLVSGIYDLEPVRLSFRNEMLKLDRAAEIRNSPCRNLPAKPPRLLIAFGEKDTAEFCRQAQDFAALYGRRTSSVQVLELTRLNHYETIETLTVPDSQLTRATCRIFELV